VYKNAVTAKFKRELRITFCGFHTAYQISDRRELKRRAAMHCGIRMAASACDARIGNLTWKKTNNQQHKAFIFKKHIHNVDRYIRVRKPWVQQLGI
jgi:hypothetical protein